MSLTESQAQKVVFVRALEQAQDNGGLWTSDDAVEATRATKALLGTRVSFAEYLARRAQWALDAIRARSPGQLAELHPPRWPYLAAWLLIFFSLLSGFATDYLASAQHINIVEVPLVLLIGWNLLIFVWFGLGWLLRLVRRGDSPPGPVSGLLSQWRTWESTGFKRAGKIPWMTGFVKDWRQLSGPINAARFKIVINLAALCFTLGALSSLVFRGFAKEYRAGWESTYAFVNGDLLHTIVSWVLTPGSWLLTLPIPDAQHIAGLRMPESTGEVAQTWIWLYGASVLMWVVLPRLCLVALNVLVRWRLRRAFPLSLRGAYFTALRAAWQDQHMGVVVVPFRYELSPDLRSHLAQILKRIFGLAVTISVEKGVVMGPDATDWQAAIHREGQVAVIVVFSLTATAEADAHGALLQHLRKSIESATPIIPIVDTSAYRQDDLARFRQRCNQWRQILDKLSFKPLFLDLQNTSDDDLMQLQTRLNHD